VDDSQREAEKARRGRARYRFFFWPGLRLAFLPLGLCFRAMRRTISKSTWAEIRTAYASGIGLREIARNMNIPEGTILSRAKREAWPGDALSCFAFSDDYSFGILQSGIH